MGWGGGPAQNSLEFQGVAGTCQGKSDKFQFFPSSSDCFIPSLRCFGREKRSICGTKVGMLEPQGRHSVAGCPAWTHGRPRAPINGTQRPETDGHVVQGRPPAFRGQEQLGQSARETNPPANDECVVDSWTSAGQSPCPALETCSRCPRFRNQQEKPLLSGRRRRQEDLGMSNARQNQIKSKVRMC